MPKVRFEVLKVLSVGVGNECFTKGTVYERNFDSDTISRLRSLAQSGYVLIQGEEAAKVAEVPKVEEKPVVEAKPEEAAAEAVAEVAEAEAEAPVKPAKKPNKKA